MKIQLTRDCWIYKSDCAEQLVRLTLKPQISHVAYNHGGHSVSAAEIADLVRRWFPGAQYHYEPDKPRTPLVDNIDGTRLAREIGYSPLPLAEGVRAHMNEARAEAGLDPV